MGNASTCRKPVNFGGMPVSTLSQVEGYLRICRQRLRIAIRELTKAQNALQSDSRYLEGGYLILDRDGSWRWDGSSPPKYQVMAEWSGSAGLARDESPILTSLSQAVSPVVEQNEIRSQGLHQNIFSEERRKINPATSLLLCLHYPSSLLSSTSSSLSFPPAPTITVLLRLAPQVSYCIC
jgi:hypothetical protein